MIVPFRSPLLLAIPLAMALPILPAQAAGLISIPEPNDLGLFSLGLLGLIVGRSAARRSRDKNDGA